MESWERECAIGVRITSSLAGGLASDLRSTALSPSRAGVRLWPRRCVARLSGPVPARGGPDVAIVDGYSAPLPNRDSREESYTYLPTYLHVERYLYSSPASNPPIWPELTLDTSVP